MKRSISHQLISTHSPSNSAVEGTITCVICQAAYAPSRLHTYLLQAPPIVLESAFMSMCHFCFRCRRPSCPHCWDNVHGVCGQCAQETQVPFRVETPPLEGTSHSFLRSRLLTNDYSTPPSLVSVQSGRFQESLPSFNTPSPARPNHYHSSNLQPPVPVRSTGTIVASSPVDVDKIKTRPNQNEAPDIDSIQTRPERKGSPDIDSIQTYPGNDGSLNIGNHKTRPPYPATRKKKPLRLFTIFLLSLALLIVVIIVTSLLLTDANQLVYNVLHIDIRAEITSLWSFLRGLF